MALPTTLPAQQGILKPLPPAGRYLSFVLHDVAASPDLLRRLARLLEDGTENPSGRAARQAALCQLPTPGLLGSSFVAGQPWRHDFDALFGFSQPVGGGYYWCPPARGGHLDLRLLGHR